MDGQRNTDVILNFTNFARVHFESLLKYIQKNA